MVHLTEPSTSCKVTPAHNRRQKQLHYNPKRQKQHSGERYEGTAGYYEGIYGRVTSVITRSNVDTASAAIKGGQAALQGRVKSNLVQGENSLSR